MFLEPVSSERQLIDDVLRIIFGAAASGQRCVVQWNVSVLSTINQHLSNGGAVSGWTKIEVITKGFSEGTHPFEAGGRASLDVLDGGCFRLAECAKAKFCLSKTKLNAARFDLRI